MLDIFRNKAFNTIELTEAINVFPNKYGRLQELNLFPGRGVRGTTVSIEIANHVLNVLPSVPRGGPPSKGSIGKRSLKAFTLPHFPHEDSVLASDVNGVRRFGSENDLESVQDLLGEKLDVMSQKHDITLETLRWSALNGIVLDPVTQEILIDLFDFFGTTQQVFSWNLADSTQNLKLKANQLLRWMEQNLQGATKTGIRVFASPEFMDKFTTHNSVVTAYDRYTSSQEVNRNDVRRGFNWQGITFEEQVGSATTVAGDVIQFIQPGEAIAFPEGTNMFRTYFGSADFIETVNKPGEARYAKQERMKYDLGIDVYTESNPLPIALRPQLLVKLTL